MRQGHIRATVASIVLLGHFLVFAAALVLGFFGPLRGTDLTQVILMASPILAVTAAAAIRFVLEAQAGVEMGDPVGMLFAVVVIVFPVLLLLCIFSLFLALYVQATGFGPNELKISLGAVETFFGGFIGAISDKLFGALPKKVPYTPAPAPAALAGG